MTWFDLPKELRHLRSEATQDFAEIVGRSPSLVTPIIQAVYKLGQLQAQMLSDQEARDKAEGIREFCEQLKNLTAGSGTIK